MSDQLQKAGRYVLDHPKDVALLTMREQARRAGVRPATMSRFAQFLGLSGFDEIRQQYAEAIRDAQLGFSKKAGVQFATQKLRGERAVAAEMIQSICEQIAPLAEPASLDTLTRSAALLAGSRRIHCLGFRAIHAVLWHFHYVISLLGDRTVFLDSMGGVIADRVRAATSEDTLLVSAIHPYPRMTVEIAEQMHARNVPIIAITDSEVSPLVRLARHTILVSTTSPSFFPTLSPAFVAAETLAALVAGHGGTDALEALRRTEEELIALNVYHGMSSRTKRT